MTSNRPRGFTHRAWAHFRFSVVGSLLSSPPARGELRSAIEALIEKVWRHPVTEEPLRLSFSTVERWYYVARSARQNPVRVLQRRVRKDLGRCTALRGKLVRKLLAQYKAHPRWSYKLHADNLGALVDKDSSLGPKPSYSTILRFMKARGLLKRRRRRNEDRPALQEAEAHFESREVRSYESPYVGGLWHLDFHKGSRKVLTESGEWRTPVALGIHDDYSRLCCHLQWYLNERAEDLVHGICQALEKRGVPREALMDNGAAMIALEVVEGFPRISVTQSLTLPYSPHQNGKEEVFWGQVEGRLLAMLEGVAPLSLAFLNEATQAWVEMEYNRTPNKETGEKPIDRFIHGTSVLQDCPSSEVLRNAFRAEKPRTQRQSDGTVLVEGVRFEVPARFRHLKRLSIQYARWDLGNVHIVDPRTGALLSPLYPLDRQANADGKRRTLEPIVPDLPAVAPQRGIAPLMQKLLQEYSATGLPPAYIPKPEKGLSS